MKRMTVSFLIFLFLCTYLTANNLESAVDFFESLLIEDFERVATLSSFEGTFNQDALKIISDDVYKRYGKIVSYRSYETAENQVSFVVQMEHDTLVVSIMFDTQGKVIRLDYLPAGKPEMKKTQIDLQTVPDEASVYINGIFQGWTPLVLDEYPGVYELEIRKNGFLSLFQTLQLNHLDQVDFNLHLMPAVRVHQIDVIRAKSVLLNSFDRGGWFEADWVKQNITNMTLSQDQVTQGRRSFKVDFQVQEPSEVIIQYPYSIEPRDLEGAAVFFIDIFMDYDGEAIFSIALQTGDQWQWIESDKHVLEQGIHYAIPARFSTLQDFDAVKVLNLKLFIPQANSGGSIYYDNLRYFKESNQSSQ